MGVASSLAVLDCEARHEPLVVQLDVVPAWVERPWTFDHGRLSDRAQAEILASERPEHARARRILQAMNRRASSKVEPPPSHEPRIDVPKVNHRDAVPEVSRSPEVTVAPGPIQTVSSRTPARPTLTKIACRRSAAGISVTVRTSHRTPVGVVKQPDQGLVRLLIEARASPDLLAAHPRCHGVDIREARQLGALVHVTLGLAPGWSVSAVDRKPWGAVLRFRMT